LFQSNDKISIPEAGTVNAARETGVSNDPGGTVPGAKEEPPATATRRSKIFSVPSDEQVAKISGWCGEKIA